MSGTAVTVKQLNLYIKSMLEGDQRLSYISIKGEISNFKCHYASGHLYFTLKDDAATLKCVMFKGNASRLTFVPQEGMKVICSGRISVFERDGVYQLYAENMVHDGQGDLLAALEALKAKLENEGLFDRSRKRPIPRFPKNIAVITSETGAAVRDIFNVLGRRYPACNILFCPATVQGNTAPKSLCNALDIVGGTNADLVIIGRGGGSIEDLWCFNDEALVRKVAGMPIPVISAVGHETDYTLCDFAADLRAPTPSAAAELAVPDGSELLENIKGLKSLAENKLFTALEQKENALQKIITSRMFSQPEEYIFEKRALSLDYISDKIVSFSDKHIITKEKNFSALATKIDALSPIKTMLRGFAVAEKDGKTITSVECINENDHVSVRFSDGRAICKAIKTIKE